MKEWAEADNQSKNLPKSERQALNEVNRCLSTSLINLNFSACVIKPFILVSTHSCFFFIYQHFQSVLQTLEEQVAGERQRLVETHLARVEAILNNNRRVALENYLNAVQSDPPQVNLCCVLT